MLGLRSSVRARRQATSKCDGPVRWLKPIPDEHHGTWLWRVVASSGRLAAGEKALQGIPGIVLVSNALPTASWPLAGVPSALPHPAGCPHRARRHFGREVRSGAVLRDHKSTTTSIDSAMTVTWGLIRDNATPGRWMGHTVREWAPLLPCCSGACGEAHSTT